MGESTTFPGWSAVLVDQLEWHWHHQARPRLVGLTDAEHRWEPVPDAWNVRPRGDPPPPGAVAVGTGAATLDVAFPTPDPAPVTTIAWRLAHLVVGVLGDRNARYFQGPPTGWDTYDYPLQARAALRDLDAGVERWIAGVRALGEADLRGPCRERGFEREPLAGLVLHVQRELVHHLAEVALLRDLWLCSPGTAGPARE